MELSVNHLLGIKYLNKQDIDLIFETADHFKEVINRPIKKVPSLRDITIANIFFENSTRTKLSFELAQKRLSADELEYITDHTEVEDTVVDGKVTNRISWATLMGYKQTWAFAIGKFMTDGVWWFFLFWLPGYLKDQYSMEGTAIIIPLTVLYSMTMVGSIGGGYFPTYFINKGMKPYDGRMKAMLMIAFIPLVVLAVQPLGYLSYWVPVIFIGIGASAHQAWSANIYTTVSDMFPKRSIATVVGIGGMAGGLGGVVVSKVGGWLFDSYKLKAVNATWSSATNTGFSDYLNKVVSLNVTDKKGILVKN